MSNWRIPPLGWCAVELMEDEEVPAHAMVDGTSLCREHAEKLMRRNSHVLRVVTRAPDEDPIARGIRQWVEHVKRRGG